MTTIFNPHGIFLILMVLLLACNEKPSRTEIESFKQPEFNETKIKDQFVKANQLLLQKENEALDYYAKTHQLNFTTTKAGIRYLVYKASEKGDSIKPGMQIRMEYKVTLLDGTECYNSKTDGIKTLLIEEGDAESGIHRGLQYLKRGDKAILLLPSSLAHGLMGDFKKIPPQMPIVYDVHVY